jgi:hypothetical protein
MDPLPHVQAEQLATPIRTVDQPTDVACHPEYREYYVQLRDLLLRSHQQTQRLLDQFDMNAVTAYDGDQVEAHLMTARMFIDEATIKHTMCEQILQEVCDLDDEGDWIDESKPSITLEQQLERRRGGVV